MGRFWAGSMFEYVYAIFCADNSFGYDYKGPEPEGESNFLSSLIEGVLFRYDPDGSVHRMIEGLMIPNGIFPM